MNREEGYYWIKFDEDDDWEPRELCVHSDEVRYFRFPDNDIEPTSQEEDIFKIGPKIEPPKEENKT